MMDWRRRRAEGGEDFTEEPDTPGRENLSTHAAAAALFGHKDAGRQRDMVLLINSIEVDQRIQVRIGGLNQEHVENLAAVIENGGRFKDTLIVVATGYDAQGLPLPPVVLADGFHRYAAHQLAYEHTGDTEMLRAYVTVTIADDPHRRAAEISQTANLKHGIGLSNREKRERVLWPRVLSGHDWHLLSDSALARELGVARQTVKNWLIELAAEHPDNEYAQLAVGKTQVRTADGTVYDTSTIKQEAAQRDYSRPQKTARAAVRDLRSAWERLERLGFDIKPDEFEVIDRLVRALMATYEIADDDL